MPPPTSRKKLELAPQARCRSDRLQNRTRMTKSIFFFQFRLAPFAACSDLCFQRLRLLQSVEAECIQEELVLNVAASSRGFPQLLRAVTDQAVSFVSAHAFTSYPKGAALRIEPRGWLEVGAWQGGKKVFGRRDPSFAIHPVDQKHPDNTPFRRAAAMHRKFGDRPPVVAALRDFRQALIETGDYSAFFSFRVLEDIACSFGVTKDDKPKWDVMNEALGTSPSYWKELTKRGTRARHLKPTAAGFLSVAARKQCLDLAHSALKRLLSHLRRAKTPQA